MKKADTYTDNTPGIVNAYYEANDVFLRFLAFIGKGILCLFAMTAALGFFVQVMEKYYPAPTAQTKTAKQSVKSNKPVKQTIQKSTTNQGVSP